MKKKYVNRKSILTCFLLSAILLVGTFSWEPPSFAEGQGNNPLEYAPGEIIIIFEKDVDLQEAETTIEELGGEDSDILDQTGNQIAQVVTLPEEQTVEEAIKIYNDNPEIAYAQPNYCYTLNETTDQAKAKPLTTTDTYYNLLWHFKKIYAEQAWDVLAVAKQGKVKVAVLDTGLYLNHPDMGSNVDTSLCKDTSSGVSTVQLTGDMHSDGHGTHVAGIIGATANNSLGVAGVAAGKDNTIISLFAIKVFTYNGYAYTDGIVRGINYAKDNGAKVINMSLGYATDRAKGREDKYLESACKAAVKKKVTVVCAGGNDGTNSYWATKRNYPADFPACISVISTNESNRKSYFSSYGSEKDISAPGSNIYSTIKNGNYGSMSGTSMASPVVTGVVAMLYSVNPNLSVSQVKSMLYSTATDIYKKGWDKKSGWGIANAEKAVRALAEGNSITYKLNGGRNNEANPPKYLGTFILKTPARGGYSFAGWYRDSAYKSRVRSLTGEDCTVYAKWAKVKVGKTAIRSLKKTSSKSLKVTYKKIKGARYQIAYSKNSNFRGMKTKNTKKTKITLKGLKSGKRYYVKVRAYKFDSKGKKIYGKYSKVKSKV